MKITLTHGTGGKEMQELIRNIFSGVRDLRRAVVSLREFDDAAVLANRRKNIVISTDSYTVKPVFFPGGDIGKLAAYGSINDVAVMGADPIAALDSIVVEEGFLLDDLKKIVSSMVNAFEEEGVQIVSGDLKVMPKGQLDGIIITTTVLGEIDLPPIVDSGAKPGDLVVVSGTIGDHGAVITAYQYGVDPSEEGIVSDCASVLPIMRIARELGGIHAAKDPTRGGVAMALNEIAEKSRVSIWIREEAVPIKENVRALMELLGIDPYYLACEGRVVIVVDPDIADELVLRLKKAGYTDATIIGEVKRERPGYVIMETVAGGYRIVEKLHGELTPRIC